MNSQSHSTMAFSSSSSSHVSSWKYHVFLSFRGEDTRKSFIDHLYAAFRRKGMIAFRDDKELQRGHVISHKLLQAIQQSLSAVVVLSPNYGSSTWCLDELQNILESKATSGLQVFPVFYGVDPSHVRNQRGSFEESFEKYEEKFGGDKKKIQKWRDALQEVSSLSGWDSNHWLEAELIENIVEKVWMNLQPKLPSYEDGLVGIDLRVKEMDSLLSIGLEDVRFIGIWGMGGIGKTTLVRVIYERISSQFDNFCFLHNVREVSQKPDGLLQLQRKLLSCLKLSNFEIDDLYDGKKKIRNLMCNRKVLLVLDDISSSSQTENLAANREWFGASSRIIITTRDEHLLVSHGVYKKYETKILNANYSLQLFSQHAFKSDQPPDHYLEISEKVVQYTGGLPLALEVLGSFLCGRSLHDWEEALERMKQFPPNEILNTLRVSYSELEQEEKTIFLDIALFFTGRKKVEVEKILKDCGFYPTIGINILIQKSLLTCRRQVLEMHDLLQEMGKHVVFQESPNDVSKRSRLWSLEDINQVLKKNKGTEFIQGITLKSSESCEAQWDPEAFSKMCNLRVLIILCDLHLPLGLRCLSSSLQILEWRGYPLKALPLALQLDELVHLKMHYSKIKQLWNGAQYLRKLKSIDLSHSKDVIETPNIFGAPCLERLVFKGCENLVKIHESVAQHKNLAVLNLDGCMNLKTIPRKLEMKALKKLILSRCPKIKKLPEFGESMECLLILDLRDCKSLVCLPQSIHNLKSLRNLNISGCSKMFALPNNLNEDKFVEELNVRGTAVREVPSSVANLTDLKTLLLRGCGWLITNSWSLGLSFLNGKVVGFVMDPLSTEFRLHSLSYFSLLKKLDLTHCNLNDESIPDDIGGLLSLEVLRLGGNNFVNLPACIANLSRLAVLGLNSCRRLETLPKLPPSVYVFSLLNCIRMAPVLFESQRVQETFAAYRWKTKLPFRFCIPGSEVPAWFHNREYFVLDPQLTDNDYDEKYGFMGSMIVEIPDYCCSSDWMGIAVCLSLGSNVKPHNHRLRNSQPRTIMFQWGFKAPDTEMLYPLHFNYTMLEVPFYGHHLHIVIFGNNHLRFCKRYLKGDQRKVQLIFCCQNHCNCGKLTLKNCGYRVICKEDQAWQQGEAATQIDTPSNSSDLNQPRIAEINDELEC